MKTARINVLDVEKKYPTVMDELRPVGINRVEWFNRTIEYLSTYSSEFDLRFHREHTVRNLDRYFISEDIKEQQTKLLHEATAEYAEMWREYVQTKHT